MSEPKSKRNLWIAIGAVAAIGLAFGAWKLWAESRLERQSTQRGAGKFLQERHKSIRK